MNADALAEQLRERELELHATRQALAAARAENAAALDGIARIVGASGRDDALERTLETARVLLQADEAFLVLVTGGETGVVRASTHPRWTTAPHFRWAGAFQRARRGRPVLVHRPQKVPLWLERPAHQRAGVESLLLAPISADGETGVMVAVHGQPGAFDRASLDRARTIGPVLGAAIENVQAWTERVADQTARALAVEADQALLRHRHELLVSAMDTAVLMESADGRITLVNPAFGRLFGLDDPASLVGRDRRRAARGVAALYTDPGGYVARLQEVEASDTLQVDELALKDGRVFERSSRAVLDADGRRGRIWIYREVTGRVLSTRALASALADMERADTHRQQMLGQISHEIRSPIQSILAMTEALRGADLPTEHADMVHAVRGASAQVSHMLTELLDLSRLESGTLRIATRSVDPGEVVEEVVESFGARAAGKQLWLRVAVDPGTGRVETDPDRVRQVVTNLIGNAIKYTDRGGVTVRVDRVDHAVRVRVTDTGPGLSGAEQAGLFRAYSQVRGATGAARGVGLGLYICHRLVERLGGALDVSSQPGAGATFCMQVPGAVVPVKAPTARPERVQLVGFAADAVALLRCQLASMGAHVTDTAPTHLLACGVAPPAAQCGGAAVIVVAPVGAPVAGGADTTLRGPVTRSALERAFSRVAAAPLAAPVPVKKALQVIIADDDAPIRRLLQHFIAQLEPTPTIRLAETGAEAVDLFRAQRADAVLLDSDMPVMDGSTAALEIRRLAGLDPDAAPVLLVALTGHDDPGKLRAFADAGVDRVFTKPVSPRVLVSMLDAFSTRDTGPDPRSSG